MRDVCPTDTDMRTKSHISASVELTRHEDIRVCYPCGTMYKQKIFGSDPCAQLLSSPSQKIHRNTNDALTVSSHLSRCPFPLPIPLFINNTINNNVCLCSKQWIFKSSSFVEHIVIISIIIIIVIHYYYCDYY